MLYRKNNQINKFQKWDFSLKHTHPHTHTCTYARSLSLSLSNTHTHTHTHTRARAHTHRNLHELLTELAQLKGIAPPELEGDAMHRGMSGMSPDEVGVELLHPESEARVGRGNDELMDLMEMMVFQG